MNNYYLNKLSSEKLNRIYEIAPKRIQQYLNAEIDFVLRKINPDDLVLELGCGYGRIFPLLANKANSLIGIDISLANLQLAKELHRNISNCFFAQMNAEKLAIADNIFDVVVCIQNGISAFHVDPKQLIMESIRVTKPKGHVLYSSYSDKFWNHRLEWFQLQSHAGLIGEIDYEKTGNGIIVCKDGFTASTVGINQFKKLILDIKNLNIKIEEIDESAIFCEMILS